ncbi:MAG: N-acetyltransferase [Peptococcaceae bacterium]|nr:N-acetyltransferase [Peptococcaceae bacterium]
MHITLRREEKRDWNEVERITYHAFLNAPTPDPNPNPNEPLLARKLRSCRAFVPELDYVAELDGALVGNIMYTKSKIVGDSGEWETLTFGPVSVPPKYQKQGIGKALIDKTLTLAREKGFLAVLIFGHESYYPRFGFVDASKYGITTAEGENFPAFMALPLYDGALDGVSGRLFCDDVYFTLDKGESDALNTTLLF